MVGEHPELGKWRMEISRGRWIAWIAREGATNKNRPSVLHCELSTNKDFSYGPTVNFGDLVRTTTTTTITTSNSNSSSSSSSNSNNRSK
ncbi:hypothetical protein M0804_011776 [Polistes exclamans]|nr:hypothetical protein M0804_011776 [Polistes exclamans]